MGLRMNLRKAISKNNVNSGFPEFSEMPEFHQAPKAVDKEWVESALFSPEIQGMMKDLFDLNKKA